MPFIFQGCAPPGEWAASLDPKTISTTRRFLASWERCREFDRERDQRKRTGDLVTTSIVRL